MKEGPSIEGMIDRLASIPGDFMKEFSEKVSSKTDLNLPALVNDLLLDTGDRPLSAEEVKALESSADNNYRRLVSIFCHIYHDRYFIMNNPEAGLIRKLMFSQHLSTLGKSVSKAELFISDPDRREELCRLALRAVNLFPQGENENRAKERLGTLDSVERKKILDKTRQAQERAREIREAMLRKEAEEAASKMSRE